MPKLARDTGFTLVELLLVVTLIAVLSSFLIPGFSNYIDTQNIRQAQELLKSDLRNVQNKALTGVGSSSSTVLHWGLKIIGDDASNYIFFQAADTTNAECDSKDASNADETSDTLPGDVVILNANGACIFFSLRNGDVEIAYNGGSDTLTLGYEGEAPTAGVQINSAGMIRGLDL